MIAERDIRDAIMRATGLVIVRDKIELSIKDIQKIIDVLPEVTVYSIVNSLIELQSVNKVQISVDGNPNVIFRDTIDLAVLFERNLDIMKVDYGG